MDLERFLDNESCEGLELQDLDHFAEKVKNMFGNGVKAEESVLAALAAFAYVAKQGLSTQGAFKQVINLSIAIGGDADTIASMAGAMAGALYGTIWHRPRMGILRSFCHRQQLWNHRWASCERMR